MRVRRKRSTIFLLDRCWGRGAAFVRPRRKILSDARGIKEHHAYAAASTRGKPGRSFPAGSFALRRTAAARFLLSCLLYTSILTESVDSRARPMMKDFPSSPGLIVLLSFSCKLAWRAPSLNRSRWSWADTCRSPCWHFPA